MPEIRVAIAGVGNCASSLIQGIFYYARHDQEMIGLMHHDICGYEPRDIKIVAAFDIDERKVGRPLEEAIFAPPNCTKTIETNVPATGVRVLMGHVLDGVAPHMKQYPPERTFVVSDAQPVNVGDVLAEQKVDVLLNYLPVGSEKAARFYAEACLEQKVSLINCIPVFIASDHAWAQRFAEKGIPVIGDDVKSQIGATIIHRTLAKLFNDRGVKLDNTYQLNTGGNTDFLNMLNRDRLTSKKISKTEAVQSNIDVPIPADNIHIGPSDYVPWQKDNKVCFMRLEGRIFGDIPINCELRLSVEDSPNSGGCIIDAIRCCKVARDRGIGGVLESISAYTMKHPIRQFPDETARSMVEEFIRGERTRYGIGVIGPKIGHRLDPVIFSLCRFICRSKAISPNTISVTGTLFGFLAASLIFFERPVPGAAALFVAGFLDIIDGAVARTSGRVTRFGGFFDSVLDRYTDLSIMGSIMLVYVRHNELGLAFTAFSAVVGTALIPYARARAEAASISCKTGILERPERIVLLLVGLFIPLLLNYVVVILAVLTHVTVIQRIVHVWKQTKGE